MCLKGVWRVSGRSLKRVWKVPGRCLEGPDWTGLAKFCSGRYWVVSKCCLDIMEGVQREHLWCLESTCKVSRSCKKDFLSQKLTNVEKKRKKKDFLGQKNKLGLSLSRKKRIFKANDRPILKKKKNNDFLGQKNKLGLSLSSEKKDFLG